MNLKVLSSGSKGNSYILQSPTGKLMIEAGIPWKEIKKGLDFDLAGIVGCLISHEHLDHSKAVKDVLNAGIDVYASQGTIQAMNVSNHRLNTVVAKKQFVIGEFVVFPFDAEHDCQEPLGYLIQYKPTGYKILFLTDTYYCKYKFSGINTIMIECNYIKETLDANVEAGYIHEGMKKRLLESHMSLENLKGFLKANDLSQCQEIILLHLSYRNSDYQQMIREIYEQTGIIPKVAEAGLEVKLEQHPY